MDQAVTWYGGRTRPRGHCIRWESSSPRKGAQQPPLFGTCLLWPNGRPSQLLLSCCIKNALVTSGVSRLINSRSFSSRSMRRHLVQLVDCHSLHGRDAVTVRAAIKYSKYYSGVIYFMQTCHCDGLPLKRLNQSVRFFARFSAVCSYTQHWYIIRPHRSTTCVDAAYGYRLRSVVCRSVCLSQ